MYSMVVCQFWKMTTNIVISTQMHSRAVANFKKLDNKNTIKHKNRRHPARFSHNPKYPSQKNLKMTVHPCIRFKANYRLNRSTFGDTIFGKHSLCRKSLSQKSKGDQKISD